MERESFIFYRSFYEAIRRMPTEVQAEIYPAVMEYALLGKQPKNLSEIAQGIFLLIKPNIDVNTARYENGKKGGRRSQTTKTSTNNPNYTLTFDEEVEQMQSDTEWSASICEDFTLTPSEFDKRLKLFLKHCKDNRSSKPHDSLDDAKSHMRYWLEKSPTVKQSTNTAVRIPKSNRQAECEANRRAREKMYNTPTLSPEEIQAKIDRWKPFDPIAPKLPPDTF